MPSRTTRPAWRGRIVSGGQTGVDRAALHVAVSAGIPYGGWCPRGGWAEDHPHPPGVRARHPGLRETPSADPAQRTAWNVRDADATLVILPAGPGFRSPGTGRTLRLARAGGRPLAVLRLGDPADVASAAAFLAGLPVGATLNVAGPRESEAPGITGDAIALLGSLLGAGTPAAGGAEPAL